MTFHNAKIAGTQVPMSQYKGHGKKRGDKDYPMSSSDLRKFMACPHKWRYGEQDESTEATKWGTLIDAMLLRPVGADMPEDIVVCPETYKDSKTGDEKQWNWNSNTAKAWKAKNADKTIIKQETVDAAMTACRELMANPVVKSVIWNSTFQVMLTATYKDKDTGIEIPVCGLLDIVPNPESPHGKMICDLKTTNNASRFMWTRHLHDFGLHVQAAFYMDLWNAAGPSKRNVFSHIVQEADAPYEVVTRQLSEDFIVLGRAQYEAALKRYCQCVSKNVWPGYDEDDDMYDGWTLVQPLPWMVMNAGVTLPDSAMPTFGEKET